MDKFASVFIRSLQNVIKYKSLKRTIYPFSINNYNNLKHSFSTTSNGQRSSQNQEKIIEDELGLKSNPYFKKYAHKIKKLQKEDLDGLTSRIQQLSEKKKPRKTSPIQEKEDANNTQNNKANSISKYSTMQNNPSFTNFKGLDSVVKVDKFKDLTADEMSTLWKEYHQKKDSLCAIIPAELFQKIYERSLEFPNFIYPVVRKQGYEFFLGQFSGNTCYFTQLINFQKYKEEAPVCLTLKHFNELASEKNIVLMSGEFDHNAVSVIEAQFLANQLQLYYGSSSLKRKLLLWNFNKEPEKFNYTDVTNELETISSS